MNRINQLLTRFLDDRESLSDDELAELIAAAESDQTLARGLKQQLVMDDLLSQSLAVDRGDFLAQVDQRLRDEQSGMAGAIASESELVRKAASPEQHVPSRRFLSRRRLKIGAVIAVVAIAVLAFLPESNPDWPVVVRADGVAEITDLKSPNEAASAIEVGQKLRTGQAIRTGEAGSVVLRYDDGTEVTMHAVTSLSLVRSAENRERLLRLDAGRLSANVVKQPDDRPMRFRTPTSVATVLGTRLSLEVSAASTRLDVVEGRVQLADSLEANVVMVSTGQTGTVADAGLDVLQTGWPGTRHDALLLFRASDGDGLLLHDSERNRFRPVPLTPRGDARIAASGALQLDGGALLADDAVDELLAQMRPLAAFSLELIFRPENLTQDGPARIVTFSTHSHATNFSLGQERDRLVLRLLTGKPPKSKSPRSVELCRLADTQPHHLLVTWQSGRVRAWLDGDAVVDADGFDGDLSHWQPRHLLLGDDFDGRRIWRGRLAGLAIYRVALGDDQRAARFKLAQPLLASAASGEFSP